MAGGVIESLSLAQTVGGGLLVSPSLAQTVGGGLLVSPSLAQTVLVVIGTLLVSQLSTINDLFRVSVLWWAASSSRYRGVRHPPRVATLDDQRLVQS